MYLLLSSDTNLALFDTLIDEAGFVSEQMPPARSGSRRSCSIGLKLEVQFAPPRF